MSTVTTKTEAPTTRPSPVAIDLPETLGYRIKNLLLGPPLVSEQLATERLGTFVGMGVLTPDAISSSAYGTEEMLVELVPYVGLAAFTLVIPVTLTLLLVLFFVTMSYRQVVMVYTPRRRLLCRRTRELRAHRGPGRCGGLAYRLHGNGGRPNGRWH